MKQSSWPNLLELWVYARRGRCLKIMYFYILIKVFSQVEYNLESVVYNYLMFLNLNFSLQINLSRRFEK